MRLLSPIGYLVVPIIPSVLATGSFISPAGKDGSLTLTTGKQYNVEWSGTADYSLLSLGYYATNNETITWLISNSPNYPTTYSWTPRPKLDGFDNSANPGFYLYVCNGTDFESPFESPLFYIQRDSSSTSSTSSSTKTSTATSTPSPTGAAPTSTKTAGEGGNSRGHNESGGLSTGAKAGIGVGVAVGGLLIIGPAVFFCLRRRKTKAANIMGRSGGNGGEIQEVPGDQGLKYSKDGNTAYFGRGEAGTPSEIPGSVIDGGTPRAELDSGFRAELEGDSGRRAV